MVTPNSAPRTDAPSSTSEGLSRVGKGVGDIFSKKGMWGAIGGFIVGLLLANMFGLPPLETAGFFALAGAATGSGAVSDIFGGLKEMLGLGGKPPVQGDISQSLQNDGPDGQQTGFNVTPGQTPTQVRQGRSVGG